MNTNLAEQVQFARRLWPGVRLPEKAFLNYVRERPGFKIEHLSDLYLACACVKGHCAALDLFQRNFLSSLGKVLSQLRLNDEFVAELQQRLMESWLVPNRFGVVLLSRYSGSGPLRGWIYTGARRMAQRLKQKEIADREAELLGATGLVNEVELEVVRAHYRKEFSEALGAALSNLSPRDRNILRLHYLSGMPWDQVASAYRVHRATVARWFASSREEIAKSVIEQLTSRLKVSRSQMMSLWRLLRSQIEVSFPSVVGASQSSRCLGP